MFEPYFTRICELSVLEDNLSKLRARFIRAALKGDGQATWCSAAQEETEHIVRKVDEYYQSEEWKGRSPDAIEEPDENVKKLLLSSRNVAIQSMVLLHRLLMETPVVGCSEEGDRSS